MTQEIKLKRSRCEYRAENARFLLDCDFSKQYLNYYHKRLEKTKPFVECNFRSRWSPSIPVYTLAELASASSDLGSLGPTSPISPGLPNEVSFVDTKKMRRQPLEEPTTSTQKNELFTSPVSSSKVLLEKIETPQTLRSPIPRVARSQQCIVIGTVFKRMKLQPNIIKELSYSNQHIKCERYLGNYTNPDDKLVLEDAEESILLTGDIDPRQFVTGVVIAVLGMPIDEGSQFLVHEVCYAEPNFQILYGDTSPQVPLSSGDPLYLLVVSGLGFHHDMGKRSALTKALQDLIDFVWGGARFCDDKRSSQVSRILVVGGNLSESRLFPSNEVSVEKLDIGTKMKQSRQVKLYSSSIQAVKNMDDFFAQLSKTIDIDIMPGPTDPSSHIMPQQPFHSSMFPKSSVFPTFNCTTNPYHVTMNDNVEVFATSGQNIDIISKFSDIKDPIEVMKCHLKWGNSAPSAPDNLYSVPNERDDPYVINFIPEIYIAGGQDDYRAEFYYYNSSQKKESNTLALTKQRTLLLTIPAFRETFSCVLINLRNLETNLLSF